MKISHEMPLWMLKEGYDDALNDYSYALVHLFEESDEYFTHFVNELARGRTVILDNSIFELEEAFKAERFLVWVRRLVLSAKEAGWSPARQSNQLVVIVPDALDDAQLTIQQAQEFFDLVFESTHDYDAIILSMGITWMCVAQGTTMNELFDSYIRLQTILGSVLAEHVPHHKRRIGVSFNCKAYEQRPESLQLTRIQQWCLGRQLFIKQLVQSGQAHTPVHLLGCSVPQEFKEYVDTDLIVSLDTSNPVVHGLLRKRYTSAGALFSKESIKLAEMMFAAPNTDTLPDIIYNCRMFRRNVEVSSDR